MVVAEKLRLLITVKTYPVLSSSYMETVCTAGVRNDGSLIRLYPVAYRYRPRREQYKKYQWIEVDVERRRGDRRPESHSPVHGAGIRILSKKPLATRDSWAERRRYVLAKGTQTMCELQAQPDTVRSLGVVRPAVVSDFVVEPADPNWSPLVQSDLFQLRLGLFTEERKSLEKIPFKFSYVYTCEDPRCSGHKMMIEDWEVGQLYRKMRDKYENERTAVEKVKERFLGQICGPGTDTHFFVGTTLDHAAWIIIGTFYPPKPEGPEQLFLPEAPC